MESSYGSVTWTLTQAAEQILNTCERKMLQRIYGRNGHNDTVTSAVISAIISNTSSNGHNDTVTTAVISAITK
jgi:hypothetical protein